MVGRPVYKYSFKVDGKIVLCGTTSDLLRREREHRRRWPAGRIEQVGSATTREDAWQWERQQAKQRFNSGP